MVPTLHRGSRRDGSRVRLRDGPESPLGQGQLGTWTDWGLDVEGVLVSDRRLTLSDLGVVVEIGRFTVHQGRRRATGTSRALVTPVTSPSEPRYGPPETRGPRG